MSSEEMIKLTEKEIEALTDAQLEQAAGGYLILHSRGEFLAYQIYCPQCGSDEITLEDGFYHRNTDGEISNEGTFNVYFSSDFFDMMLHATYTCKKCGFSAVGVNHMACKTIPYEMIPKKG